MNQHICDCGCGQKYGPGREREEETERLNNEALKDLMDKINQSMNHKGKGGLRKIANLPKEHGCLNPGHDFPSMIVLEEGVWEHTCPGCGHTQVVTVQHPVQAN